MDAPYPAILHSGILGEILHEYRSRLIARGFLPLNEHLPLSYDELVALAPRAVAVFGPGHGLNAHFFRAANNLKVVSLVSSGWDAVDVEAATRNRIPVVTAPAEMAESVADLTWGLLLCSARQIPQRHWLLKTHQTADTHLGSLVYGKTLGIIGMGFIGKAVARRAAGFKLSMLSYDFDGFWDEDFAAQHRIQRVGLEELLSQSDFISLHLRPTPQTIGFLGERELSLMKPTAFLINTARANLVDGAALYRALSEERIAGLGTDVDTDNGLDAPILSLPNVICTPHIGGRSLETAFDLVEKAVENALLVLQGKQPAMLVNPDVYTKGDAWRP
jgi:phosphoglycerate dehydrogenase-like enzyme